ncbi:hypothetical protein [Syntrophorhabdus aromaticivorans]|uniref:hypothetical protein n=1 Tax=Syntrophorhabdus aromaticivorans TaxID=328301 RepID=UPI0004251A79|nr:hypothetical protein [Syntrophorhabdus aromaticivorans]
MIAVVWSWNPESKRNIGAVVFLIPHPCGKEVRPESGPSSLSTHNAVKGVIEVRNNVSG